ncbi:MAG: acetyl-CoA carboxylase biotin carboxyl carrier protein subunit [Ignavibacteriae bacterium HGW-Ignavibacteriae-1]|jgi:biotin carboxyl carrier protein|nr:MAG: acetyl-CoA carboxylase biotin carboxyl carrier protein subunit [Ignavibacteriae bacterium HGW-Ignavibacteriae-1]
MNNDLYDLNIDDTYYETKLTRKFVTRKRYKPQNHKLINAFIPGTIREIYVKPGQIVEIGQDLLVLEAMKMKNLIKSGIKGKILKIHVELNKTVAKNELLIEYE